MASPSTDMPAVEEIERAFRQVHDRITAFLNDAGGVVCREDRWDYANGDGGGITRIWEDTELIEKGGVNFSAIRGPSLPQSAATKFDVPGGAPFLATGVSLVIHPRNPHVPTIHLNVRFFETGARWWFGGGVDLTPYYPVREQVATFHRALKELCDAHGEDYAAHKDHCDRYFWIAHRNEMRGVGGIFFDHLQSDRARHTAFTVALGLDFPALYEPLIKANRNKPFTPDQVAFQHFRRGRYAEFNLVYDRGTLFGLQSGGRIESILMSLPPIAHWRYDWKPAPGTPEAILMDEYLQPRDWLEA